MLIKEYFDFAQNNYLCNTSYPLSKSNWEVYKNNDIDLFEDEKDLSFYIHIPFCKSLCAFCEYVKYPINTISNQKEYINILRKDVYSFLDKHKDIKLYGFDIGGGTPTALDDDIFIELMDIYADVIKKCHLVDDFEASIEGTFATLNEKKIKIIKETGINRISLGIQTSNAKILEKNNRYNGSLNEMVEIINIIKRYGISKVNLDLMYGLQNQTEEDLKETLNDIRTLNPEQVTLYEMRYNMVKINNCIDREKMYKNYIYLYTELIKMGYYADFGQNTFSKDKLDRGVSSYLRYRMINNISYKGFGISAQSKSKKGISYNIGKTLKKFDDCLKNNSFSTEDNYLLPSDEMLAKYITISLYYGKFNIDIMKDIIEKNPFEEYKDEFTFLLDNNYIVIDNNIVSLTKSGFKYYGAIGALFYSKNVKEWLIHNESN